MKFGNSLAVGISNRRWCLSDEVTSLDNVPAAGVEGVYFLSRLPGFWTIDKYVEQPPLKAKSIYHQLHIIDRCFSPRTVEEILYSLEVGIIQHRRRIFSVFEATFMWLI